MCSTLKIYILVPQVYSRPRIDKLARPLLITMGIVITANALLSYGTGFIDTLYLIGPPFHFNSVEIGTFISVQGLVFGIGPLFMVPLLLLIKFNDIGITMYGLLSGGFTFLILGLAQKTAVVYTSRYFIQINLLSMLYYVRSRNNFAHH